ncbi:hypothetical protein Tco_0878842 [Tanacetum coccineum]|uniref:Uncharacterized protein n=1 Tax=Tanacetum coccineum TaxID=301880 RepID=A0ABQ5BZ20_9ASTR
MASSQAGNPPYLLESDPNSSPFPFPICFRTRCGGSVQGSTSAPKGKGTAHTSASGSKAYGLIDEDYEEDIGLSEDDGVNEELGIDVDDEEDDDEEDY